MEMKTGQDERLPEPVRERWRLLDETIGKRAEEINAAVIASGLAERINEELREIRRMHAKAPRELLLMLYRVADAFGRAVESYAACKAGCSHCCHIPVAMSRVEARLIGSKIGRGAANPPLSLKADEGIAVAYGNPCPFLKKGACSIYEHRPLMCRVHWNMDEDALLCELHPEIDAGIPVPYLDVTTFRKLYIFICGPLMADIRRFFPEEE
jgi:Fe-S-cluster containining protein